MLLPCGHLRCKMPWSDTVTHSILDSSNPTTFSVNPFDSVALDCLDLTAVITIPEQVRSSFIYMCWFRFFGERTQQFICVLASWLKSGIRRYLKQSLHTNNLKKKTKNISRLSSVWHFLSCWLEQRYNRTLLDCWFY